MICINCGEDIELDEWKCLFCPYTCPQCNTVLFVEYDTDNNDFYFSYYRDVVNEFRKEHSILAKIINLIGRRK